MSKDDVLNIDFASIQKQFSMVNSGGCGWVAYTIHKQLQKRGIKHKVAFVAEYEEDVKSYIYQNRNGNKMPELLDMWNDIRFDWMHMVVVVDDCVIDSIGVHKLNGYKYKSYRTKLSYFQKYAIRQFVNQDGWNTSWLWYHNKKDVIKYINSLFI